MVIFILGYLDFKSDFNDIFGLLITMNVWNIPLLEPQTTALLLKQINSPNDEHLKGKSETATNLKQKFTNVSESRAEKNKQLERKAKSCKGKAFLF